MSVWDWLAIWLGFGAATVVLTAARSTDARDVFSRDEPLISLVVLVLIILMGPLAVVGVLTSIAWTVWFKPHREADGGDFRHRESVLCEMIALRSSIDPRLTGRGPPEHLLMWQLWETTEATILELVDGALWRMSGERYYQDGGMEWTEPNYEKLIDLVRGRLRTTDPQYLLLGDELLLECAKLAVAWAELEHERGTVRPYPPGSWWQDAVSLADAQHSPLPLKIPLENAPACMTGFAKQEDWDRLQQRYVVGDVLRCYASPAPYWEKLGGDAGVVLTRGGQPIGHVTLARN